MKKSLIFAIIILSMFIVGCLDYKAYEVEDSADEESLINEIAQIERELGISDNSNSGEELLEAVVEEIEVVEEVILPDLEEAEFISEEPDVITVKESEKVKLNVKIVDPDEDEVSYTFGKPLDANGEWQTNYGDAGEYFVTITATDGILTTEKSIKIVVQRVNVAPIISELSGITVREGENVDFTPKVNDPNNDPVTITVSEPLADGNFETDHTSSGEYQITVLATDGELDSESSFKLIIIDVNELPIISGVEDITIKEGETVTINPEISDLDEDEVTLTITEPVGNDGVWVTDFTDHGEYFITVLADDGKDKVNKRVRVVVEDVNMPPEIVEVSLAIN